MQIFEPAPKGTRKVIVSTNLAETSVTIEGIGIDLFYVITFQYMLLILDLLKFERIIQDWALRL